MFAVAAAVAAAAAAAGVAPRRPRHSCPGGAPSVAAKASGTEGERHREKGERHRDPLRVRTPEQELVRASGLCPPGRIWVGYRPGHAAPASLPTAEGADAQHKPVARHRCGRRRRFQW